LTQGCLSGRGSLLEEIRREGKGNEEEKCRVETISGHRNRRGGREGGGIGRTAYNKREIEVGERGDEQEDRKERGRRK